MSHPHVLSTYNACYIYSLYPNVTFEYNVILYFCVIFKCYILNPHTRSCYIDMLHLYNIMMPKQNAFNQSFMIGIVYF